MFKSRSGFTLVEILIVVTIIGILAGVVVTVIDPMQQRNKAKDAGIQSALNRSLLAAQGYVSAYSKAPSEARFFALLENVTEGIAGDCTRTDLAINQNCRFSVVGVDLPNDCSAAGWRGDGNPGDGQCYFFYFRQRAWDVEHFRIYAKSWGLAGRVFVVDNQVAGVYHCDGDDVRPTTDLTAATFCELWTN